MKNKLIVFSLFIITLGVMSCNNSKTAIVGDTENNTSNNETIENKEEIKNNPEAPVFKVQEIKREPTRKFNLNEKSE